MTSLYPPAEPFDSGMQRTADAVHALYYEQCGNPAGVPVLFLHGGPGSSINSGHRRFFDPTFYRAVLFDQRGCGRSTPRGAVEHNTTAHLVEDIEHLRERLGVSRWVLFGGSWGSTLALAYAQAYPQRVCALVLRGVFLASAEEVDWYLTGMRRFLPQAWEAFAAESADAGAGALLERYADAVFGADGQAARAAARRWSAYESAAMAVGEALAGSGGADEAAQLDRVRVQLHYLRNACFLMPGALLRAMPRIAQLPALIVQGRRDLVCPPVTAYTVSQVWPAAQLRMVEDGGHSALHPAMAAALVRAIEDVKGLCGA